jgi:predicted methyltransferase
VKAQEKKFDAKLAERPDLYGKVIKTHLLAPAFVHMAPNGSADLVLTFRNAHNWAKAGNAEAMFKSFYDVLKPGGVLGVVDHRAKPGTSFQRQIESGYLTEAYVIGLAEGAGFKLVESSEVNANSKDTADHPKGVWTLPPTLALGNQDRDKYLAIGESDRMTLKFVKPVP